jgi:hypothetical protein
MRLRVEIAAARMVVGDIKVAWSECGRLRLPRRQRQRRHGGTVMIASTKVEGLWRKAVKGSRGATPRPGSMTEYIETRRRRRLPLVETAHEHGTCETCPGA